ncbi:MAG TPA: hypothetical protein ENH09_03740 [Bacteroidetes bacterium]|nr:hypothetical protein [Bacteroidota bacterium]
MNPSFYHGLTPMAALISSAKADSFFHIQLEFPEIFRIFKIPPFPNLPIPARGWYPVTTDVNL